MSEDYNKLKLRVKTVEEAMQLLTNLSIRANERMDGFDASLNNLTVKIEALVDAQIHTEDVLSAKVEALSDKVESLASAQESLTVKVESLVVKFEVLADAQIRTEESLKRLTDAQTHTSQRLDALIDIVREGREGRNGN
jgi:seryl-tRNA synthetase